jgi:hypothetical protein
MAPRGWLACACLLLAAAGASSAAAGAAAAVAAAGARAQPAEIDVRAFVLVGPTVRGAPTAPSEAWGHPDFNRPLAMALPITR